MTSAQRMLFVGLWAAAAAAVVSLGGCSSGDKLTPPTRLTTPYDTSSGDVIWAIVPPRNESGTSLADTNALADALVAAASEVSGITALPVNRSIRAMRALGLDAVTSPSEAEQLASTLGADAVIVSTLTAWDPYDPPVLGISAALYAAPGRLDTTGSQLGDTRLFAMQATDGVVATLESQNSRSTTSQHLDARDHEVLMALHRYAEGRVPPNDPLGREAYLKSMPLYTAFTAQQAVSALLDEEWLRLARARLQQDR
jgi:hypothetical protein